MNPLVAVEVVKQLFKWGGSGRKEGTGATMAAGFASVYVSMEAACAESCTFTEAMFAPSGLEWSVLLTSTITLIVHLNRKRMEADKNG